MKRTLFLFFICCALVSATYAQSKKLQLEVNGSLSFAVSYDYIVAGFGPQAKLLYPIGQKNNALTATLGIDRLFDDITYDAENITFALASFGYRKIVHAAFIEPKVGFGLCHSGDLDLSGFVGIEGGIHKRKFRYSIDYRLINVSDPLDGDYFHTLSFRVGYRLF